MANFTHYSDCATIVTLIRADKAPKKIPGVLITVEDQIKKTQLTACMSKSSWISMRNHIDKMLGLNKD